MCELRDTKDSGLSLAVRMILVHRDIIAQQQAMGKRCHELAVKAAERGDYDVARELITRMRQTIVEVNKSQAAIAKLELLK